MKKFLLIFLCVIIFAVPVKTYSAYNYDYRGNAIPSQAGYDVENVLYFDMYEPQVLFFPTVRKHTLKIRRESAFRAKKFTLPIQEIQEL